MSDNSDVPAKLIKIKKSIHFPGDNEDGLPYLGKDVAGCTSVIKNDAFDLAVDERIQAALVHAELINWCRTIQPLYPLNASGTLISYAICLPLQNMIDCRVVSLLDYQMKGLRFKSHQDRNFF